MATRRVPSPTRGRSRSPPGAALEYGRLPRWGSPAAAGAGSPVVRMASFSSKGKAGPPGAPARWASTSADPLVRQLATGKFIVPANYPQTARGPVGGSVSQSPSPGNSPPGRNSPAYDAAAGGNGGEVRTPAMRLTTTLPPPPPQTPPHGFPSHPAVRAGASPMRRLPMTQVVAANAAAAAAAAHASAAEREGSSTRRSTSLNSHRSGRSGSAKAREVARSRLTLRDTTLKDVLLDEPAATSGGAGAAIAQDGTRVGPEGNEGADLHAKLAEVEEQAATSEHRLQSTHLLVDYLFRRLINALEVEERMGRDAIVCSYMLLSHSVDISHFSLLDQAMSPFRRRRLSGTEWESAVPSTEPPPGSPRSIKAETIRCLEMEHRLATAETRLFQAEVATTTANNRVAMQDEQIVLLTRRLDASEATTDSLRRQLRAARAQGAQRPKSPLGSPLVAGSRMDSPRSPSTLVVQYNVQSEKPTYLREAYA